jgi:hypothetical protein
MSMTVRQLIKKLRKCDPDAEVETEGCDCYGDVRKVVKKKKRNAVLLRRS